MMTTITKEHTELKSMIEVSSNGDEYWHREFETEDSVNHVHHFQSKTLEAQVKCGLELWRAQLNLKHGAWLVYLFRCGMKQPTAWNRKNRAKLFLTWAGILGQEEKPTQEQVVQGMELAHNKSLNFNDFRQYLFQLDYESIRDSLAEAAGGTPRSKPLPNLLGFQLGRVLKGLHGIDEAQHTWTDEERQEVRDGLQIVMDETEHCLKTIDDFNAVRTRKMVLA